MMSVAAPGVPLLGGWASGTVGRMGEWVQKISPRPFRVPGAYLFGQTPNASPRNF